MSEYIHSKRLDLIPMTPGFLRASLRQDIRAAEESRRISLPAGWPGEEAGLLSMRLKQLEDDPALQPWLVRAMVIRETGIMVGHIGFHTAPCPDYLRPFCPEGVEFGFTVLPAFRRQGYARESAIALMTWGRLDHDVRKFVMTIRPDNIPSQRLAAQLGFVRIGSHIDEVDGLEEILECDFAGGDAEPGSAERQPCNVS